jgi:hypothetical protein
MAGDHRGAAQAWQRLGRPYDAALAWLTSPDEAGLRDALKRWMTSARVQQPPRRGAG